MMLRSRALGLVALFALAACTAPEAETTAADESDIISLVPGSGIQSPNARHDATYLSVRSIENLRAVGALQGVLADLAARTDGIIATRPDGRISVQELLQIEKPGFVETLFPEEKAALPKLWALMETTNANPSVVTVPDANAISVDDLSTGATSPIEPANLGIDTLPSELQRTARRLELTQDSDGDSLTVTKADLSAAIANPSAYLPSEVDQLKAIQKLFLDRAGTTLSAKVRVNEPTASTSVLATWGPAQLSLQSSLAFTESRRKDNVNLTTTVTGQVTQRAVVTLSSTVQILMLDTGTEKEALVASGQLQTDAGTKTVEIWQNGQRLGSYRTTLPALRAVSSSIDLSQYADYTFVLANGKALVRNATSYQQVYVGGSGGYSNDITFNYSTEAPEVELVPQASVDVTNTPKPIVAAGRYSVPCGPAEGNVTVDIFPEGILRITRTNGSVQRAVYQNAQFILPNGDLRFNYSPDSNSLQISNSSGTVLYSGPLTGAMRTG
ncbi:MAG: hypothetical protein U0270_32350 [Labilithrix sp.]